MIPGFGTGILTNSLAWTLISSPLSGLYPIAPFTNSSIQESLAVAFFPKTLLSTNTATLIFLILPGEISRFLIFLLTS